MSVTAPRGFLAEGVAAGVKPDGALDVALVAAETPVAAAAVFTTNAAAAAPVTLSRAHLAAAPTARAVLLNSGCANAGTGPAGRAGALATAESAAKALDCAVTDVLVCSTGAIGPALPVDRIAAAVPVAAGGLAADAAAGTRAATAIMTTDTVPKETVAGGRGFTVGGMAKGAGMVRPDMATMLAVLTTDAAADPADLQEALAAATDVSFHSLNIDGCPSTNDAVVVLASGASGVAPPREELTAVLAEASRALCAQLAADAEGAGRVVTLRVTGATDDRTARALGRAAADSALVRAAFYGGDPNWGRILGALGASGLPCDVDAFGVRYQGVPVAAGGREAHYDRPALTAAMATGPITIEVVVGGGPGSAEVLTTDLTPDYVRFNAEYS